jgi:tRNA(Ile2)-agmatinylcytidine synthase
MKYLLGIDDTDSSAGLCTTYLGFRIASQADQGGYRVSGYPRVVRLNPNIPFKTRGNAAVCLPLETDDPAGTFRFVSSVVESLSDIKNGANTGVVFVRDDQRTLPLFKRIYHAALSGVVNKERVAKLLRELGVQTFRLGNGMGLVGAASSVAFDESYDHTYELIAYRQRESWGAPRWLDPASVREMDQRSFPETLNNYDYQKERVLIAPHGPDPVFLGVRGATPRAVIRAFRLLRYDEELDGHIVWLSNHCTDAHLERELEVPIKAYSSGWVEGEVFSTRTGPGGHRYLELISRKRKLVCAVYEPTGDLNRVARLLIPGDRLRVMGGVRRPSSRHEGLINTESIEVLSLAEERVTENPSCPHCGLRMKSEGMAKGFECQVCGRKRGEGARRGHRIPRRLRIGRYLPSPRAYRHLTKPLMRYGRENAGEFYPLREGWIRISSEVQAAAYQSVAQSF